MTTLPWPVSINTLGTTLYMKMKVIALLNKQREGPQSTEINKNSSKISARKELNHQ